MEQDFVLPLNEITVLLALGALGIVTVIGLFLYLAADAFFGKNQ